MSYLFSIAGKLADQVGLRLRKGSKQCRTVTLKLRYCDWETISRSHTCTDPTNLTKTIYQNISLLIKKELPLKKPVRLLGVSVSNLCSENVQQQSLFGAQDVREAELTKVTDHLKEKYGEMAVVPGSVLYGKKTNFRKMD